MVDFIAFGLSSYFPKKLGVRMFDGKGRMGDLPDFLLNLAQYFPNCLI